MADGTPGCTPREAEAHCYNCGQSGHWAIACPEPTRPVPAGVEAALANRQGSAQCTSPAGNHPGKRRKGPGPVITRYGPPPTSSHPVANYAPPPSQSYPPPYSPPPPKLGYLPPYQQTPPPPQQYGTAPGHPPPNSGSSYAPSGATGTQYGQPKYNPPPAAPLPYQYGAPPRPTGYAPPGRPRLSPPPPLLPPSRQQSHSRGPANQCSSETAPKRSPPPLQSSSSGPPPNLPPRPNTFPPPLPPSAPYPPSYFAPSFSHHSGPSPRSYSDHYGADSRRKSDRNNSWNQKSHGRGWRGRGHGSSSGHGGKQHKNSNHVQSHTNEGGQDPPGLHCHDEPAKAEANGSMSPHTGTPSTYNSSNGTRENNNTPSGPGRKTSASADASTTPSKYRHPTRSQHVNSGSNRKRARNEDDDQADPLKNKRSRNSKEATHQDSKPSNDPFADSTAAVEAERIERRLRALGVEGQAKPVDASPGFYPIYMPPPKESSSNCKPSPDVPSASQTPTPSSASPKAESPTLHAEPELDTKPLSPHPASKLDDEESKTTDTQTPRIPSPDRERRSQTPDSLGAVSETSFLDPLEAELLGLSKAPKEKRQETRPKPRQKRHIDDAYSRRW